MPTDTLRRTAMEVILLERVAKLGQMGEVVRVKDGFARNFLLPQGKALRATKDNRARFETMKGQLEARNLELKGDAEKVGGKIDGQSFLNTPIKNIGLHRVPLALHPEIEVSITINVARSADEAERIARGESVIAQREERLVMATGEAAAAEDFFENPENISEEGEPKAEEKPATKGG